MPKRWQLQEAKNRLSQLLRDAESRGPQVITRHGKESAVVLSVDEYRRLESRRESLVSFFRNSPLRDGELDLSRSADTGRDIDL